MNRKAAQAIWLCLCAASAVHCVRHPPVGHDPNVIATVDGIPIDKVSFERELGQRVEGAPDAQELAAAKQVVLDRLVNEQLLLKAARERNLALDPTDVERRLSTLSASYPPQGLDQALAQAHLTPFELKQKTLSLMTIEKLFQEHVYPRVTVTEAAERAYYQAHLQDFQTPEETRMAQILVKDSTEAKRLLSQLKSGHPFDDLAQRYSIAPEAKVGGDLGYFPRGVMPPAFDEVAFRLGPNQLSGVVATVYGFHLFKVLDRRPAQTRSFDEARHEVERRLMKESRVQAEHDFVATLRQTAKININPQALLSEDP